MVSWDLFFLRCLRDLVNIVLGGQGADVKFCMGGFGFWLEKGKRQRMLRAAVRVTQLRVAMPRAVLFILLYLFFWHFCTCDTLHHAADIKNCLRCGRRCGRRHSDPLFDSVFLEDVDLKKENYK